MLNQLDYARPQRASGKAPIAAMICGIVSGPLSVVFAAAVISGGSDVAGAVVALAMPIAIMMAYSVTIHWNLPEDSPRSHRIFSAAGWIVPLLWAAFFAAVLIRLAESQGLC